MRTTWFRSWVTGTLKTLDLGVSPHWLALVSVRRRLIVCWHRWCLFTVQTIWHTAAWMVDLDLKVTTSGLHGGVAELRGSFNPPGRWCVRVGEWFRRQLRVWLVLKRWWSEAWTCEVLLRSCGITKFTGRDQAWWIVGQFIAEKGKLKQWRRQQSKKAKMMWVEQIKQHNGLPAFWAEVKGWLGTWNYPSAWVSKLVHEWGNSYKQDQSDLTHLFNIRVIGRKPNFIYLIWDLTKSNL
jgi:hypothetical protein